MYPDIEFSTQCVGRRVEDGVAVAARIAVTPYQKIFKKAWGLHMLFVWQAVRKMSDQKKLEGTLEYKSV